VRTHTRMYARPYAALSFCMFLNVPISCSLLLIYLLPFLDKPQTNARSVMSEVVQHLSESHTLRHFISGSNDTLLMESAFRQLSSLC